MEDLKNGHIQALTRSDCRDEWLAVLKYPHLPVNMDDYEAIAIEFDTYIACVNPPDPSSYKLPACSDKDDQKFLEIARDTQVEALITKDKALLKLARKMKHAGMFRIETPEQYLRSYVKQCDKTTLT
jgi:predicted nucleic acid-binding protein